VELYIRKDKIEYKTGTTNFANGHPICGVFLKKPQEKLVTASSFALVP